MQQYKEILNGLVTQRSRVDFSSKKNAVRHYVVIALLSAVSSARMRPWLIFVIPCGSRSVFSKSSLRHSLSLLAVWVGDGS